MTECMAGHSRRGRKLAPVVMVLFLLAASPITSVLASNNNLHIKGHLVREPCSLDTNFEASVDFGTVIKKGLYQYGRTNSKPLTILLKECDIAIGNKAVLTFTGQQAPGLEGYLAVSGQASGIGIGMALTDANNNQNLLPINHSSPAFELTKGDNRFTLDTWVEGAPEAIKKQTIIAGDFTAVATFAVSYP